MSVLNEIAYYQNRRDEEPNKELAQNLFESENKQEIQEIVDNLYNKHKSIQSDCLAVIYHIGYLNPKLISDYYKEFLNFLSSKNNRMVWGSMIALETISSIKYKEIWENIDLILHTISNGTLITEVWGIKLLSNLSSINEEYHKKLYPILFNYLKECRPIDFPKRTETLLKVIDENNVSEFIEIINSKRDTLKVAQSKRLDKILKSCDICNKKVHIY